MQPLPPNRAPIQLELFAPPRTLPQWLSLPLNTRQQTLVLLAQLLQAHRERALYAEPDKEAGDD